MGRRILVPGADGELHSQLEIQSDEEHADEPPAAPADTTGSAVPDDGAEELSRLQQNLIALHQQVARWQRERDEAIQLLIRERSEYRDVLWGQRERLRKLIDAADRHWGNRPAEFSAGDIHPDDDTDMDQQTALCYPATWLLPDEPLPTPAGTAGSVAADDETEEPSRLRRDFADLKQHADRLRRERNKAKMLWAWEKAAHIDAEWCHEEYLNNLTAAVHRYRNGLVDTCVKTAGSSDGTADMIAPTRPITLSSDRAW
jgi:hypothetical protein